MFRPNSLEQEKLRRLTRTGDLRLEFAQLHSRVDESKYIDENWSLVDTELYEADPEYYESLGRHRRESQRATDAKAANALHHDRLRKQHAEVYSTLGRGTESPGNAIRFLQAVMNTNNGGPRSGKIGRLE
jgi:hypothetical protein